MLVLSGSHNVSEPSVKFQTGCHFAMTVPYLQTESRSSETTLRLPARDVRFCLQWMSDTYRTHFQVFEWHGCWIPVSHDLCPWSAEQFATINLTLESSPEQVGFRIQEINDRDSVVTFPIESLNSKKQIAIGFLPTNCARNISDVLNLLFEQLDLNRLVVHQYQLLEEYTSQQKSDLVELSWFRSLAEELAFRNDATQLTSCARQALEHMKKMIGAQSLFIVLRIPSSADGSEIRRLIPVGPSKLRDSDVFRLIDVAGSNAICEVYLDKNMRGLHPGEPDQTEPVAIVPAICSHRCFGWLIAVGHDPQTVENENLWESCGFHFDERAVLMMESASSVLATHAHNQHLLSEQQELLLGTVRSLVNTIDTKDRYTWGHSDRVAQLAQAIAREYGLIESECEKIYLAGLLHDIGKIGVRDEVLQKTGGLTQEEFEEIKTHPLFGFEILKHLSQLKHVLPGVLYHHESWDGTGYPHQLEAYEIPLAARILAVADAFDAMTSDRPYRRGMPFERAEQILRDGRGKQWDEEVVDAFFRILDTMHEIVSQELVPLADVDTLKFTQSIAPRRENIDPLLAAIKTSTTLRSESLQRKSPGEIPAELEETVQFIPLRQHHSRPRE